MQLRKNVLLVTCFLCCFFNSLYAQPARVREDFDKNWTFHLGDIAGAKSTSFDDASWRKLNLPHDWSIELPFDSTSPTGTGGGALRGGLGWYRKTFTLPASDKGKNIFIDFDGVYCNSEVFINGHSFGVRPNGYISFRYDLTPYLKYGSEKNVIAVKVDNSRQPNSRWYSGSGIYRNVWLVKTGSTYVDNWGTYVKTPSVSAASAKVNITTTLCGTGDYCDVTTTILNAAGAPVATQTQKNLHVGALQTASQAFTIRSPVLWSIENPYLYKAVTRIVSKGKTTDEYSTVFGIRSYQFDVDKGFFLNGKQVKIVGVCNHHDLGCLGTAINTRALERQLQIMKGMGVNGIRTSHNPPAPELLDLCDKMGFIVMNETFDMWKRSKNKYDYSNDFDEWYQKDLKDQVLRDRNHPSVFIWSVGNEIPEQWAKDGDTSGGAYLRTMQNIVRSLDDRPTVTANNEVGASNQLLQTGINELVGYNYHHQHWPADSVQKKWGRKPFIVTESVSALQTRGHYDMPSDSMRIWPQRWDLPVANANADLTCSAYENCFTPWGSSHLATLKTFLKHESISGMFVWTGFDYIGEPTPYPWPARSSYFGIVDLAGFPKDVYYLYQSLFTSKNVLHLFPHWNWQPGQTIDMWAYYNNADEVELFINGKSQGVKKKAADDLHVMWRVKYEAGRVEAVSRKAGKVVATRLIRTAGAPARIILEADRRTIQANGKDLSFITIKVVDKDGNLVPDAANKIQFTVNGAGFIAGVDNGDPTSLESFKASERKAFNGLCLAVVQSNGKPGSIKLQAKSAGLSGASIDIISK
ncbi:glycoside hydrolase family 2 TIM barrel-domain containing protein [Longitalea luteola]|uniref:glycoside hydrolase family 2 TIM barrel-domain containing protein n=1 Tax=Longitalea luteola TaxID=2812563 RepID=UPI001A956C1E|nr:glycoside hydrolase family 2 TIM barrel-domain containing protein [Longitalea luteola]